MSHLPVVKNVENSVSWFDLDWLKYLLFSVFDMFTEVPRDNKGGTMGNLGTIR